MTRFAGLAIAFTSLVGSSLCALQAPLYGRLPTGSIKPAGWQLDQANVQAEGLAGHLMDWAPYVKGSIWSPGGSIEYSEMHEAAPYWFNGMVALAFQLGDERIIGQVRSFLDHTLDTQQDDGWIGPERPNASGAPRLVWPRYLILMALTQYAEADPTQTDRIVESIHRFTDLVHNIWKNGTHAGTGFQFDYQFVRWEELVYSLQWLHDNYPNGKEDQLVETMELVRAAGFNWKNDWFVDAVFPKAAVTQGYSPRTHGVNIAEALKSEALVWRWTNDESDKDSTFKRLELLYKYHGFPSGTYSADEHLAGLRPRRGTELCTVVEQMLSLAIIYQTFGDNSVADRAEKIAYNALPAAITHDWWSHQYDQQPNQIWAKEMNPSPFGVNGPLSNVFGFEPTYPCCTVNHPSGYPKFWANAFYTGSDGAQLVHVFLGPYTYSGTLSNGVEVDIAVDTLYPFGNILKYRVTASDSFTFKIRIPGWATGDSTISVNGADPNSLEKDNASHQAISVGSGTTDIVLSLKAELQVETRTNGAVAVTYGPLLYAVDIEYSDVTAPALRSTQALGDVRRLFPNAPPEYLTQYENNTVDHVMEPSVNWALAIDPSSISINDKSTDYTMPYYAWAAGSQPITLSAIACPIKWGLEGATAADPPQSPNACTGDLYNVTMVPYGAAKLRLGEIPTMERAN